MSYTVAEIRTYIHVALHDLSDTTCPRWATLEFTNKALTAVSIDRIGSNLCVADGLDNWPAWVVNLADDVATTHEMSFL